MDRPNTHKIKSGVESERGIGRIARRVIVKLMNCNVLITNEATARELLLRRT